MDSLRPANFDTILLLQWLPSLRDKLYYHGPVRITQHVLYREVIFNVSFKRGPTIYVNVGREICIDVFNKSK